MKLVISTIGSVLVLLWTDPSKALSKLPPINDEPVFPPPASSCAAILCPTGTECVERPVVCITAPCPAMAECVLIDDPCSRVRCAAGTQCEVKEFCTRSIPPQCRKTATCVPAPTTCPLSDVCGSASDMKSCRAANDCCLWLGRGLKSKRSAGGKCVVRPSKSCSPDSKVPCNGGGDGGDLVCPEPTGFGTCAVECSPGSCPSGQLCCSNGCGTVCMQGVPN